MILKLTVQSTIENITMSMTSANADIIKFSQQLAVDPVYAFEWSERAMEAAAFLKVASFSLQYLEQGADVVKYWMESALHGARSPKHSTCVQTNAMDQMITSAYATMLDRYAKN